VPSCTPNHRVNVSRRFKLFFILDQIRTVQINLVMIVSSISFRFKSRHQHHPPHRHSCRSNHFFINHHSIIRSLSIPPIIQSKQQVIQSHTVQSSSSFHFYLRLVTHSLFSFRFIHYFIYKTVYMSINNAYWVRFYY
jgi:hypothetical protein